MSKPKQLSVTSTTKTLAIKCYEEQLLDGENALYEAIRNTDKEDMAIVAIKHTGDGNKEHWHIVEKKLDRNSSFYVSSELKRLGIHFRAEEDRILLANHSLESVGKFTNYCTYLLHKTDFAKKQHKTQYGVDDLVSNLGRAELEDILNGYVPKKERLSDDELINYARQAGYDLMDFEDVISKFSKRGIAATLEKKMKASYNSGVKVKLHDNICVNRLCLTITCESENEYIRAIRVAKEALKNKKTAICEFVGEALYFSAATEAIITVNVNRYFFKKNIVEVKDDGRGLITEPTVWAGDFLIYIRKKENTSSKIGACFDCRIHDNKLEFDTYPEDIRSKEEADAIWGKYQYFTQRFNEVLVETEDREAFNIGAFFANKKE